jgi:hypothetical protein
MRDHDRRQFQRVPFRAEVTVRAAGRTLRSGSTLDLSMNGILLEAAEAPPAEGTPCDIAITLTGSDPLVTISARGFIVRSGPGTLAARLSEVDLDSYQHLRQLILHNAADPDQAERELSDHQGIRPDHRKSGR